MIQGTGIPDGVYIRPQLYMPGDGCAGGYYLNSTGGWHNHHSGLNHRQGSAKARRLSA
jgi:hypothetical protein